MSITEFLLARIAEDEAVAVAAEPHEEWISVGKIEDGGMDTADGEHVARWSPARALAECEAKRRIVAVHSPAHVTTSNDGLNWDYRVCTACLEPDDAAPGDGYWPCLTMALLAQPYADHPDYDPAWRLARD